MQDTWFVAVVADQFCDAVEVLGPAGENKTVPALDRGPDDVVDNGSGALVVFDDFPEDLLDVQPVATALMCRLVDKEVEALQCGAGLRGHPMAYRAAVHGHERLEARLADMASP